MTSWLAGAGIAAGSIDRDYFAFDATGVGVAPGRLSFLAGPTGVTLGFTYDGPLMTSETYSGAVVGSVGWNYDTDFRPRTETVTDAVGAGSTVTMGYDQDSLLICTSPSDCSSGDAAALRMTHNGGNALYEGSLLGLVEESQTHSAYGELASLRYEHDGALLFEEVVNSADAPRDERGRITERVDTLADGTTVTWRYTYNIRGWLTEVDKDGALHRRWTYDGNGNRLSETTPDGTIAATYDAQDRLLTYGDWSFEYTANGELTKRTNTVTRDEWDYVYDAVGNLRSVRKPDGTLIEYLVDGKGRRVGKKVDGVVTKQWLYRDALNPVAELDGTGNLVARFVFGSRSNVPDYVIRDGETYRVVVDHLGSPQMAVNVDDSSDVPFTAGYEAFGEVTGSGLDWLVFGFAGGVYDADTGLVRFGARDYLPEVGRWVSKDPIRFGGDGSNLYGYVVNDPISHRDPSGLRLTEDEEACREACIEREGGSELEKCIERRCGPVEEQDNNCIRSAHKQCDQALERDKKRRSDCTFECINNCSAN